MTNCHLPPVYTTDLGTLYAGDCVTILRQLPDDTADTVFADPPFNIGKKYGPKVNDARDDEEYVDWCKTWLRECLRLLKSGGSLFVYNIPKWNMVLGAWLLEHGLEFRHWIAVQMNTGFPIRGKLRPSHYSLLYFSKGKPKTFQRIRVPIEKCRHCGRDIKDYGGHRKFCGEATTLQDVWNDISTVRHWKFKSKKREANALSTKLLQRVIHTSTCSGDLVLDPFGGSGTTYAVCEQMGRRWIGMDIESAAVIIERLQGTSVAFHRNDDLFFDDSGNRVYYPD